MCTWMSSDDDFFVLRRFGEVGARVLLLMQDQIAKLEEELQQEDDICKKAPKEWADNGTFRGDPNPRRVEIMHHLSNMLERYRKNSPFQAEFCRRSENLQSNRKILVGSLQT